MGHGKHIRQMQGRNDGNKIPVPVWESSAPGHTEPEDERMLLRQ